MPKRHSKGGTSSANVVPMRPSVDWNSQLKNTPSSETQNFGNWKKDTALQLTSHPTAFEVWLVAQANSIHPRAWTLEEAKLLFTHVDVTSRQPFSAAAAPPRFARTLRALRAFCGTILLGMGISGCTNGEMIEGSGISGSGISRYVDEDYGVACYTTYGANNRSMSCVQVKQGTKP